MKILLAGPGTGKTTKIKELIKKDYAENKNILVLSFTNATVTDLTENFSDNPYVKCHTLHSYALIVNHLRSLHILDDQIETPILEKFAEKFEIEFNKLCYFFQCITFKGMIESCSEFLRANPVYGKEKIGDLDLLIVDEFQDFNLYERELIFCLSTFAKETLILGDDDQSIYEFKDASPDAIIELFNNPEVEKIGHENICYRCPDIVVEHSERLISKNKNRVDKEWKKSNREGNISFNQISTQQQTSQFILDEIKAIKKNDAEKSILVLSPVKYYVQELVELLNSEGVDLVDFWTSKINLEDTYKIWWLRAIYSEHKVLNMTFIANSLFTTHFKNKYNEIINAFLQKNFNETEIINSVMSIFPAPFNEYLLIAPHIFDFLKVHPEYSKLEDYLNLDDFEESLKAIFKKINPTVEFDRKSVNLMSIHKSKGLQADYVFITGLVDGVLPNKIIGLDTIEYQRRLLFVGMTRCRKNLYLISQVQWDGGVVHKMDKSQFKYNYRNKTYSGKSSLFLSEMNKRN